MSFLCGILYIKTGRSIKFQSFAGMLFVRFPKGYSVHIQNNNVQLKKTTIMSKFSIYFPYISVNAKV